MTALAGERSSMFRDAPTRHARLLDWVAEVAELTTPDRIVWCDGSQGEWDRLTADLVAAGTLVPLDPVKRHIEHMLKLAGEDHVGLGSDYDGATTPKDIGGVEGLPVLIAAMREMGLGAALIEKIAHGNWLRLLQRIWGA